MATHWFDSVGNVLGDGKIKANGDYVLRRDNLDLNRAIILGGSKTGSGSGATVQFWFEVAGARANLDSAQTITTATPKAWPNEYTLNGKRGITVTGLNGTDDVLLMEVGQ